MPVPLARIASTIFRQGSWHRCRDLGRIRELPRPARFALAIAARGVLEGGGTRRDPRRHAVLADSAKQANGGDPLATAVAVTELIRSEVAKAVQPVACGALANLIISRYPSLAADWNGRGSFRRFAESLEVAPVIFDWTSAGGSARDSLCTATAPAGIARQPIQGC